MPMSISQLWRSKGNADRQVDPEDQQQQDGNNSAGNAKGFGHENDFSKPQMAMDSFPV